MPRTFELQLYYVSLRFQYSGRSLLASWTRSATLLVTVCAASAARARRGRQSGTASRVGLDG